MFKAASPICQIVELVQEEWSWIIEQKHIGIRLQGSKKRPWIKAFVFPLWYAFGSKKNEENIRKYIRIRHFINLILCYLQTEDLNFRDALRKIFVSRRRREPSSWIMKICILRERCKKNTKKNHSNLSWNELSKRPRS